MIQCIAFGVLLAFAGLWGGAWLLTVFPVGSDYGFPAVCTAISVTLGGVIITIGAWAIGAERKD